MLGDKYLIDSYGHKCTNQMMRIRAVLLAWVVTALCLKDEGRELPIIDISHNLIPAAKCAEIVR